MTEVYNLDVRKVELEEACDARTVYRLCWINSCLFLLEAFVCRQPDFVSHNFLECVLHFHIFL